MAKRLYTSVYATNESSTSNISNVVQLPTSNSESSTQASSTSNQVFFTKQRIIILFSSVIVLLLLFIFVACRSYLQNSRSGGRTSEESLVGFVTCLSDDSDASMFEYIPSEIRDSGFLIDTEGLSDLQKIDETFNINFVAITIDELVPLSDIQSVMLDIATQYNVDIDITDAVAAKISAKYEYKDGVDTKSDVFSTELISVKIDNKWYVCPGLTIPDNTFSNIVDSENNDSSSSGTISANIDENNTDVSSDDSKSVNTLTYVSPVEKEIPAIEPYDEALDDLKLGKVSIDGKEYQFPCPYLDMVDVFTLCYDNDSTSLDSLTVKTSIKPNYILNKLPAVFTNLNYNMADLMVSIGNRTKDNIYVDAGDVTMFYIGIPHSPYSYQIYDYPSVVLPGNVTLGTTFADVETVYGSLEEAIDKSNVVSYSDDAKVYAVQLDNSHNFLYLSFVDDTLMSVQWYYYDFNAYKS